MEEGEGGGMISIYNNENILFLKEFKMGEGREGFRVTSSVLLLL